MFSPPTRGWSGVLREFVADVPAAGQGIHAGKQNVAWGQAEHRHRRLHPGDPP
ncbi:hypothetical protein ACFZB2_36890 [Streptomyces bobili]|uniref:hypothetical protein n=1 Tax=Streptomyces bobili TaxID=67280 RepID=UPI0036E1C544